MTTTQSNKSPSKPIARAAKLRCGEPLAGALRQEVERVLQAADHANNAVLQEREGRWIVHGDPTEGALLVAARKAGIDKLKARFPRVGEARQASCRGNGILPPGSS